MGLLDDAIREHLELKRLRGADPSDVARLEREALGPVRRGAAGPEEFGDDEAPAPPPFDAEHAAEHPLVDDSETLIPGVASAPVGQDTAEIDMETVLEADRYETEGPAEEYAPHAEAPAVEEEYAPRAEAPAIDEDYVPRPAPGSEEHLAAHHAPAEDVEPPAAPAPEAPEEEPVEDVLEETPSFLQETPEHDRLWFEQQPPRGFDFDK